MANKKKPEQAPGTTDEEQETIPVTEEQPAENTPAEDETPVTADIFDLDAPTTEDLSNAEEQLAAGADEETSFLLRKTRHELLQDDINFTQRREQRQDVAQIVGSYHSAYKQGRIMNARIAKVFRSRDNAYWICYAGPLQILIPYEDSLTLLPPALSSLGKTRAERTTILDQRVNLLNNCLGVEIPFVIKAIDGTNVLASRTEALQRIRNRYFGPRAVNPVKVGDVVDATILSVGRHAAFISLYGLDVRIGKPMISHQYIPLVNEMYQAGDTLRVQVMEINSNPSGLPEVVVSGLKAEEKTWPTLVKRVRRNDVVLATVKTIALSTKNEDNPKIRMTFYMDDIGMPAYSSTAPINVRDKLRSGDKVLLRINGITEDNWVHATVIRLA